MDKIPYFKNESVLVPIGELFEGSASSLTTEATKSKLINLFEKANLMFLGEVVANSQDRIKKLRSLGVTAIAALGKALSIRNLPLGGRDYQNSDFDLILRPPPSGSRAQLISFGDLSEDERLERLKGAYGFDIPSVHIYETIEVAGTTYEITTTIRPTDDFADTAKAIFDHKPIKKAVVGAAKQSLQAEIDNTCK